MYNSQTPIDIHCSKLVDWLVQRRHCKRDWGENLATIRKKIRAAIKDMPEHEEIKKLLIGSKLDYFKSKRIVEMLKTTEASSKNFLGYYSSQRMKDWQDIVYSYERDYVYLAEIATDLIRETNYEVPGVRKVISKLNKEKDEAEKEKSNLMRRAQQFNSEHQKIAQSYGIKGENIPQELAEQSKTLAAVMDDVVSLSRELKEYLDFYREYAGSNSSQDSSQFLAMLDYVILKGNSTVYERKYGEAPDKTETADNVAGSTGTSNPSDIDLINDEIDFGDDLPSSESSSGFVHVPDSKTTNTTDSEKFINIKEEDSHEICDLKDKVAKGDDAKLVLELRSTRFEFLNNLYELEAFFDQLSNDLANKEKNSESFVQTTDSRANRYEIKEMSQVLIKIRNITSILNKEKNKILFQMNDSTSFVDNLTEKLSRKLKQASDCLIKVEYLDEKILDLDKQVRDTDIHLKKSIFLAKELQTKVESSIAELYKGRSINIMGCVA